jgi:hypothetical protein
MEDGTHAFQVAPSGTADAAISWTTAMNIDNSGAVTMPSQPAFLAKALEMTNLGINTWAPVTYGTEIFDQSGDYNTATYTFTAPVSGKYQLSAKIAWGNWDTAGNYYYVSIIASNT